MVDLAAKPFNLDEDGVRWVRDIIAGMTDEEKIGQLFVNMGSSRDEEYLADMVNRYHIGAVRYQPGPAAAIGCKWSFAPIVDLYRNWRNPIISTRTWSAGVDQTIELSLEYMRGIQESGIAPAAKHFPGDGIDERDQHLSSAPNWLSCEEWDETFGKVYSALIEAGCPRSWRVSPVR